jgi:predicted phosphate transport protein (TIGR00153 family)
LSELVRWFEKRREIKALNAVQRHLALTTGIVEDLERAVDAATRGDEKEMHRYIERVAISEREADSLRRDVMDFVSKGELSPIDREDLMDLVKRVDMLADWSRESTRVLVALPMEYVPKSIKDAMLNMVKNVRECVISAEKCVNKMMTKPEEALKAADTVERDEERVDDIHEKARVLIGKESLPRAGVAVLISQLFEAIEQIADSCEDVSDEIRIIMVRK